jgi:thioredoxin-related protein
MKLLLLVSVCFTLASFTIWQPDFQTAQKVAREKHQLILLNFSGSDWCGPCIRMRQEIFNSKVFSDMSDTTLVMLNADFPRSKKNQYNEIIQKHNNELADKYNMAGKFPFTLLLDADGKIIKTWEGMPKENAEQFTADIKNICDAHK